MGEVKWQYAAAGEAGVAVVDRVVAGLAQRAQHHAREGFAATARGADIPRHRLAERPGEAGRVGTGAHLGHGRRGNVERLEAVPRALSSAAGSGGSWTRNGRRGAGCGQLPRNRLVGGQHELLDEPVRGTGGAEVTVHHLPGLNPEGALGGVDGDPAAGEPGLGPLAGRPSSRRRAATRSGRALAAGQHRLGLGIGQPVVASDHAAEGAQRAAAADLDGDRPAVAAREQAAEVGREPFGQHRIDPAGQVDRRRPAGCLGLDRPALGRKRRHIGDVDEHSVAVEATGRRRGRGHPRGRS